jgi:site-specific recombinase XerD
MDLADCVQYHQLSLQAEGRSPATLRLYLLYERRFLEYLTERRIPPDLDALSSLNVRNATEWFRAERTDGARGGQVAVCTFVSTLKTWASFLETEGVFTASPLVRVKRPRVAKVLRQPFSAQEVMALWGATRQTRSPIRDEALLLLLLDSGMRIGEAVTLTLGKLRLDERHVIVGLDGKGKRERLVPIGDPTKRDGGRTIHALRNWLRVRPQSPVEYVFVDRRAFGLSPEAGSNIVKRLGAIAGVPNAIAHRTRHSMATHYLTVNPGDEIGLRRILGHVSDQVLADYVHISQTAIAERAGRSSLVEAMSAPKESRPASKEPIARAWAAGSLESPWIKPLPALPPVNRVSELLAGLDADERRALLKALLRGDAA